MNRFIKYWINFITWIKGLFGKEHTKSDLPIDVSEDFKDHFDFGLYCGTAWYSFPNKQIPYNEIKAMGIDFVYEQLNGVTAMRNALKMAKNAKIKLLINGFYNVYKIATNYLRNFLKEAEEEYADTFMGTLAYDEPHLEANDKDNADLLWIEANIINKFRTFTDKGICVLNCLPNYARQSLVLNGTYEATDSYVNADTYKTYIAECAKHSDVLCGDFYGPFEGTKKDLWIPYLMTMSETAKALNKPMWQFVSCTQQGGAYWPSEDILKYRICMNILFGAQAIIFFKMLDYNSEGSPYREDTTKNVTYETLQSILIEGSKIRKLASLFKNADIKNISVCNEVITVSIVKNNHRYEINYALENTEHKYTDNINLNTLRLTSDNMHKILGKGDFAINLVK